LEMVVSQTICPGWPRTILLPVLSSKDYIYEPLVPSFKDFFRKGSPAWTILNVPLS
jgi:hypothetical protein